MNLKKIACYIGLLFLCTALSGCVSIFAKHAYPLEDGRTKKRVGLIGFPPSEEDHLSLITLYDSGKYEESFVLIQLYSFTVDEE